MTLSTSTVTLAPGGSRTYTLVPGEAVTVATEPNCYVTVTETPDVITTADQGGQTNVRTSILQYKGEWTYGPYALGGTVVVAVSLAKSTSSVSATLGSTAAAVVGAAKDIWLPVSETYGSRTITNAGPIVMASATIPPLTANGRIRVSGMFQTDTTAHTRTVTCKLGGQTFASTTYTAQAGIVTNPFRFELVNYLSTAAQKSPGSFFNQAATGNALLDGTVDTTIEQQLEIVGTVATYAMTLVWLNIETCNRA